MMFSNRNVMYEIAKIVEEELERKLRVGKESLKRKTY
jgi:hypothetical protein